MKRKFFNSLAVSAVALILTGFNVASGSTSVSAAATPAAGSVRLSQDIKPAKYDIELSFEGADVAGAETIELQIRQPTSSIELNVRDPLLVTGASAEACSGQVKAKVELLPAQMEKVRLKFPLVLQGSCKLKVTFTTKVLNDYHGLFYSPYTENGQQKALVASQFDPMGAREAFPCIDEPDRKAVFQLTLVVDQASTALSNMPPLSQMALAGTTRKRVVFAPTPEMSTYLVAFVIGDLECTRPITVNGIEVKVWATGGNARLGQYALEASRFSLPFFEEYFGTPYKLPKLDMVALPDFPTSAMENWGLLTFEPDCLLADPATASLDDLQLVARVLFHEQSHQWVGNLVTHQGWHCLWLTEGFAKFMETTALEAWKPDWHPWHNFYTWRRHAFYLDQTLGSKALEAIVSNSDDAADMFYGLTYKKGALVLKMLETYLGADKFRQGVRAYIKKHEFGNAGHEDLFSALSAAAGQPVAALMEPWVTRHGFPLLSVSVKGGKLHIRQDPCLLPPDRANYLWNVPVVLTAKTNKGVVSQTVLLTCRETEIDLGSGLTWVYLDLTRGYFRVHYTGELIRALAASGEKLSAGYRMSLFADAWKGVVVGLVQSESFLVLVEQFAAQSDTDAASEIAEALDQLRAGAKSDMERKRIEAAQRLLAKRKV